MSEHPMFVAAFGREPTIEERICGNCTEFHDYDAHFAKSDRMPCGELGCGCRDFICNEHAIDDNCPTGEPESVPGLPSSFPVGSVSGSPNLPHAYNVREEEAP